MNIVCYEWEVMDNQNVLPSSLFSICIKKPQLRGFVCSISAAYGFEVVVVVLDLLAVSLSLLEELSDAFLAKRAAAIAGQPVSDTTTGTAISQHPIFTNLFIVYLPVS